MKKIYFLVLYFSTSIVFAQQLSDSHCTNVEKNIFSCNTGKKIISVCGTDNDGIQYRFGSKSKIEMTWPQNPNQKNMVNRGSTMFSGGGANFIRFINGKTAYVVYDALSGQQGEWAGVAVEKEGKVIADVKCKDVSKSDLESSFVKSFKEDPKHEEFNLPESPLGDNIKQQQKTPQPRQVQQQDLAVTQKALVPPAEGPTPTVVAPVRAAANSEPQSATAGLNLKGFNLKMSKEDVKKIIPNIEAKDYFPVDGKMRTTLSCGALFSKAKSNCSFTYAGMDVNGIVAAFWGNDLMLFKLIYNTGNRAQVDYNNFKLGSIMKNALVSKYGVQDNTSSTYSGRWIFGGEKMFLELEDDSYGLYGAVIVSNSSLVTKYQTLLNNQNEEKSKKSETENKKKTLSDM